MNRLARILTSVFFYLVLGVVFVGIPTAFVLFPAWMVWITDGDTRSGPPQDSAEAYIDFGKPIELKDSLFSRNLNAARNMARQYEMKLAQHVNSRSKSITLDTTFVFQEYPEMKARLSVINDTLRTVSFSHSGNIHVHYRFDLLDQGQWITRFYKFDGPKDSLFIMPHKRAFYIKNKLLLVLSEHDLIETMNFQDIEEGYLSNKNRFVRHPVISQLKESGRIVLPE